jgi:transposase
VPPPRYASTILRATKEVLRCLKRPLSDIVYRQLVHDATTAVQAAGLGGQQGAALKSSAAG